MPSFAPETSTLSCNPRSTLKVAVIGFGVMGRYHATIYATLPYIDLVAIVEPNKDAQALAKERHAVACFASLTELLAQTPALDAVSIVTPTWTHYHLTQQALDAGLHVLVEKPITTDVAEAQALMQQSTACQRILQVGHITRFYRAVQLLSQSVHNPYLIEARRLSPNARIQDVGVILDLMIHDIDIVLGLVPHAIRDITIAGHRLYGQYEDVAAAQIIFENGCIARFLASRVAPDAERSLVVAEKDKTLRLDFARDPHAELAVYRHHTQDAQQQDNQVDVRRTFIEDNNPLRKEIEHFLARIRYNEAPIGTLADDVRALELATTLQTQLLSSL